MKTFLKIFGGLIVIFIVVGLFLDNKINITREIEVNATPEQIHVYVGDLNKWPEWTPWAEMDPTMKTIPGDLSSGVGASQSWKGESGSGGLKFTESSPTKGIAYDMTFDGDPTVYIAGMRYKSNGNTTTVSWYMTGEMGPIIIGNYFAQLMDTLIGDSFDSGLEKLKKVVEENK
ncbi:SRPBCC family protein [Aliikangiella coralliicola]|uniref:SRPBCC family protein n=1 Tax=Aliikangiella coralliicola TaxID=2592383 RepID=A0A545UG01_9GAMM|nr:SRPBCC family protein [Aliikangiella coralliicola]TQV88365.1 SRPBCC family protein [Aliikangiella coralliicola]